ncbi:MAG: glutamate-1-semialdehyde 2,1-aminomutase [Kiritimatiellae bacterium]|nr:glutamate-1-semialdehyde 2,1-aminomutase [Kiritimatiellia bacterium]
MNLSNADWFERAKKVTPGGVNSPVRAFNGVGGVPLVVNGGKGAKVFSSDGRELTDYCCSWGAMILGHADREVTEAISNQAGRGTTFGIVTENEVLFAERLCSLVPGMEKARAVNSGTEAVMSAVRLARGVTGRNLIVKFDGCYHGHSDAMLVKSGSGILTAGNTSAASSAGVPSDFASHTVSLPFNDIATVRRFFENRGNEIAAAIVEPVAGNMGLVLPIDGFLEELRQVTASAGSLLICDEVITGFRFGLSTYSSLYANIQPDIITLGKVIGGGLPLAAVGGKAEYMNAFAPEGPVYQAGTLAGNPLAVAAGLKTLEILERNAPYAKMSEKCKKLTDSINSVAKEHGVAVRASAFGGVFTLFCSESPIVNLEDAMRCDTALYAKIFHGLFDRGVYIAPSQFECNFVSAAHTDSDMDAFISAFSRAII